MNKEDFTTSSVIEISQLSQYFQQGQTRLEILKDVSLKITAGEMVGLVGPSGSGKSTLLHLAGLLERPSGGKIIYMGQDCELMTDHQRTKLRLHEIGFIYQFHHLLPEFSALENIIMPQLIAGLTKIEAANRANQLLNMVGLSERADHKASQLSGGNLQKFILGRSLANNPKVAIFSQPTWGVDIGAATAIRQKLLDLSQSGKAVILISQDLEEIFELSDKICVINEGVLSEIFDVRDITATDVGLLMGGKNRKNQKMDPIK